MRLVGLLRDFWKVATFGLEVLMNASESKNHSAYSSLTGQFLPANLFPTHLSAVPPYYSQNEFGMVFFMGYGRIYQHICSSAIPQPNPHISPGLRAIHHNSPRWPAVNQLTMLNSVALRYDLLRRQHVEAGGGLERWVAYYEPSMT